MTWILLLFAYALLFALVEIEIEGADGWADKLPTWYRVTPRYARLFARVLSGKPLTGYHLMMLPIPFLSFHLGLAFGMPWSWALEARLFAAYLVFNVIWDVLWFALNPAFGWKRFRKGAVWWHNERWVGRFPIDYWNGFGLSFVLAVLPGLAGDWSVLWRHTGYVIGMVVLTAVTAAFAPLYQQWYAHMRRPGSDERGLVRKE
jgi:hypothetical protein